MPTGAVPQALKLVSGRPSPRDALGFLLRGPPLSGFDQVPGGLRGARVWVGPSPRLRRQLAALRPGNVQPSGDLHALGRSLRWGRLDAQTPSFL